MFVIHEFFTILLESGVMENHPETILKLTEALLEECAKNGKLRKSVNFADLSNLEDEAKVLRFALKRNIPPIEAYNVLSDGGEI